MEPDWQKCKGKDPEREREIRLEDDKEKEHEGKIREVIYSQVARFLKDMITKEKSTRLLRKSNNAGIDVRKR